jgi:tetratricopeptide (TPR) repeat protein
LLKQTDYPKAEKAFRQFILVDSQVVEAWLGLGVALNAQGKRDEAGQAFERATVLDVSDTRAWYLRGLNELERERREEAKECFERCLLGDENNLECRKQLDQLR